MPRSRADAVATEARNALPLTPFYDPPRPLPAAEPGTLIRSETFAGHSIGAESVAVRILYHSRTLDGRDVAASGVVLIPGGTPPPGGWPVIAWAHGTNRVARICAPSLMKDIAYGDEGLLPMVAAGFAVVATDNAGLGTPGSHAYLNKIPQASDVIYSIPAARQAVPALGQKWVAIGHSQGGIAIWGVAEREVQLHDPTYAGGISVAGYMDFEGWALDSVRPDPEGALFWAFEAYGIKASYPSIDVTRMLTPAAMSRYHDATTKGCYYYAYAAYRELGQRFSGRADWARAPEVRKYLRDSHSGNKAVYGPLLVIAGGQDPVVPISSVTASVHKACGIGLAIEFLGRPELDHDQLMYDLTPTMLAWAQDRLAGKPWAGNCASP